MKRTESATLSTSIKRVSTWPIVALLSLIMPSFVNSVPAQAKDGLLSRGCQTLRSSNDAILTAGIRIISMPCEYGYIDRAGKPMTLPDAKIVHLCRFQQGLAAVAIRLPDDRAGGFGPQHWGFINEDGQFAIPPNFQYACDFHEGLAAVNVGGKPSGGVDPDPSIPMVDRQGRHFVLPVTGGKWGFIDRHGEFAIKPTYDTVSEFSEGLAFVSAGGESGYINKSGQMVFKVPSRSHSCSVSDGLVSFSESRRVGYMNLTGENVIPPRFFSAGEFSCGRAAIRESEKGKTGYIDRLGLTVIEPQFDSGSSFSEGLAAVSIDNKVGFIDILGKIVIPTSYERALDFSEGLAPVRMKDRWGYIDTKGKMVIAPSFVGAGLFRKGVARVATAGRPSDRDGVFKGVWGFIDPTGKFIIDPQFDEALDFWEDKAVVTKYTKYGLQDAQGKVMVAPCYDEIGVFGDGLVPVSRNGWWGFIDPFSGRIAIPIRFECADGFSCERAAVRECHRWGFIDKSGDYVVRPQYLMVSAFSEGLAAVSTCDGKWGYIDASGKTIIQPRFDLAGDFSEGHAAVLLREEDDESDGKWGFIDKTGKLIIEPQFTSAGDFVRGRAKVFIGKKEYSVDMKGHAWPLRAEENR